MASPSLEAHLQSQQINVGSFLITLLSRSNQPCDKDQEQGELCSSEPLDTSGLDLWGPASRLLCKEFERNNGEIVRGRSVLDLGCGLGLTGIVAAKFGATRVCLSDFELLTLELTRINIERNNVTVCSTQRLAWARDGQGQSPLSGAPFDVVIGSDVLYATSMAEPLLDTAARNMSRNSVFLLSHEVRRSVIAGPAGTIVMEPTDSALDHFMVHAHNHGMQVEEVARGTGVDNNPTLLLRLCFI